MPEAISAEGTPTTIAGELVPAVYEDGSPAGVALVTEYEEEIILELSAAAKGLESLTEMKVELTGRWTQDDKDEPVFVVDSYRLLDGEPAT